MILRKLEMFFGTFLGLFLLLIKFKLKTVKNNLELCGIYSKTEIKKIIFKNYVHYGCLIIEFIHLVINPMHFVKNFVRVHNFSRLNNILNKDTGLFLLSSHIGNWEVSVWSAVFNHVKLNVITKSIKNKLLEYIWHTNRVKRGMSLIYADTNAGGIKLVKAIKKNEVVAYILDQHTYPPLGVEVNFFSRTAWTVKNLAKFVQKFSTPVLAVSCYRDKNGFFDIYIEEEVRFIKDKDPENEIFLNTSNYTKIIEKLIIKEPSQWIWLHKRWKKIN